MKVDDGLLLFFVILFLILLLVGGCLLPLGVNIRSLASFPHVELGTLLKISHVAMQKDIFRMGVIDPSVMTSGNDYLLGLHGFPLVQSHLLLLLFPGSLGGENITKMSKAGKTKISFNRVSIRKRE